MPAPTGAMVYRDALITVDGTDYANQLRKARLVPDQPIQTYRTLVPDGAVQDSDSEVWVFEIEGLQINIAGGLAVYLRGLAGGTQIACVLQPKTGVGLPKATFTAVAMKPEFGGEQGTFLTKTLSLPVVGTPTFGTS
jgi:hypothetical protein